ncbi:phosphate ABC transporter substrate-binding protein, PhoT family [Desulfocurvibacter africanus PCS]|uniref:Phosphate-binding protein n=1 Tax=Desulfocurvibacter africanus PCS TaxID=1262666 RepID=M5PUL9_DESAF|nr:phosphate ABC transporter substrate-binding protein [Desulfocurvibacter africanus]EMG37705.1 phosphate ABC transporter substrate-binding protein, PhoT family [Desulfocurvibacter africanus PCS]
MLRKLGTFIFITFFILAMSTLAMAQGLDAFKGKSGNIEIAGGTAHIPVMKEAAKRIMTANPAIRITVAGGGSGVGVQKAGEGLVDIGNTGRAVTEAEKSKYGLFSFPFAIDGVAVVVHKANPLHGLTQAQVKDIFAGKITNWKQLGGPNAAIDVYTRDEASGTREVFWEKMLSKGAIIDSANVVASNGAMKTAVAGDKNAIGYVSIGHIDDTLKAPLLDGVEPSQETAVSGAYKVTRLLYMNTKGEPQGIVKSFIEYVRGPEGAEITKASGYIPTK